MKKLLPLVALLMGPMLFGQGFLRTDGQKIVDAQGNNVILRGLGLGGWMVQESYMLQTSGFAGPQHESTSMITELIGDESTEAFFQAYLANGVTKRDIYSLKAWGFNSVRLPIHYNIYTPPVELEKEEELTWLEKGFVITNQL